MQRAFEVASMKSVKTDAKVKALRKNTAVVTSKSAPINGFAQAAKAEVPIKQTAGAICAVMSLPPPTGQPPEPQVKSPRIPDRAASPYRSVKRRRKAEVA